MTTAATVVVVGDIATDVLAVLPVPLATGTALATGTDTWSTITLTPGGSAANTAIWLTTTDRGRVEVVLVASVGDDGAGDQRLAELAAAGVDCRVRRHPATATGAVVVLSDPTERTMLCDRGANRLLSPDQIDETLTALTPRPNQPDRAGPAHLHLSAYPLFDASSRPAARHALAAARTAGLTTSVDAASAGPLAEIGASAFLEWTAGADLLIANLDETRVLADLPGDAALMGDQGPVSDPGLMGDQGPVGDPGGAGPGEVAEWLRRAGRYRHVVVKLGAGGAVWAAEGQTYRCAADEVVAVDPTGAGDAFAAGLLAAWLGGARPAEALRAGAALGARAVSSVGARPAGSVRARPAAP